MLWKTKIIVSVLIICVTATLCTSCKLKSRPVADSIRKYLNTIDAGVTVEVKMTDFTSFEWDKVLIFNYPVTNKDINIALGVNFTGSTDLTNGMIFVKDDEIVHYEYFDYTYDGPGKFMIYSQLDLVGNPNYRVFLSDEAVFSGSKKYTESNFLYYRLYPIS